MQHSRRAFGSVAAAWERRVVHLSFPVFFLEYLRRSEVQRLVVRYVLETSGLQPAELVSVSRVGAGQPAHRQAMAGQRRAIDRTRDNGYVGRM